MAFPTLQASPRTTIGRKNYKIREEGLIPAVVYGAGIEPQSIQLDRMAFVKLYRDAGESTIVELQVDGKSVNVLMYDYQLDPIRDEVIHADFRAVDMNKELETNVKIEYIGESAAVKGLGGTLVTPLDDVPIRALPANLPKMFTVDLSKLETFDDAIRIEDIDIPEGVEVLEDLQRTIAVVTPPRSEEELAALDEAIEENVEGVEVEGEAKEGEEGEEEGEGTEEGAGEEGEAKEAKKEE